MTFEQYIVNPLGVKNSVFGSRYMYRDLYTEKLNKVLVRELGKISYILYKGKTDFYIHMKVPSEVVNKFYYDVVVRMYPKDAASALGNLKNYEVQFFSNDPSFTYTFAHSFSANNLFVNDLKSKMDKYALKHKATERNPKDEVGYVKSIYFCYLIMDQRNLFNKSLYYIPYSKDNLLKDVMDSEDKIQARQDMAKSQAKKKVNNTQLKQKSSNSNKPQSSNQTQMHVGRSKNTNITSKTKITSKTSKTKKVNRI